MSNPFTSITGTAYRTPQPNIDTDIIIAAEHLKTIRRTGLGIFAFEKLRTQPGNTFDDDRLRASPILIAGANFGCGSSREHAVWAMADIGLRAVIAPSFGDIYYTNALKNGFLNVALPQEQVDRLLAMELECVIGIDLPDQVVVTPTGDRLPFEIDAFPKHCLVQGLDHIGASLQRSGDIAIYELRRGERTPWLANARVVP